MVVAICDKGLFRSLLNGSTNRTQPHPPTQQHPPPDGIEDSDIKETEHQTTTKHDGMVLPSIVRRDSNLADGNGPRKDPAEVRDERLVEIPRRACRQQNGRQLRGEGVEDVAPVDGLVRVSLVGRAGISGVDWIWYLPHCLCYCCHGHGLGEVEGKAPGAPFGEEDA